LLDKDEVFDTLKDTANNKAPGIDGITAEILKECWSIIGNDFYKLIKQFWDTEELYPEFLEGIIRLIPKLLILVDLRTGDQLLYYK
jgi:hypothetical protein